MQYLNQKMRSLNPPDFFIQFNEQVKFSNPSGKQRRENLIKFSNENLVSNNDSDDIKPGIKK